MAGKAAVPSRSADQNGLPHFLHALMWAFGGALLFALPTLMTMEMWDFATQLHSGRFALFIAAMMAMLIGLSHYAGFEDTFTFRDDVIDAFIAFTVGTVTAALVLLVFGVLGKETVDGMVGAIALQALPCSMGALLARHMLGRGREDIENRRQRNARYSGQLFLMAIGAMFLSFSLAATEEMVLIAYKMSPWHTLALIALTLLLMHAYVGAHVFRARESEGITGFAVFTRFTLTGYALALTISAYVLWTFGRLDGLDPEQIVKAIVVLGLPAAVGAAASRLIL